MGAKKIVVVFTRLSPRDLIRFSPFNKGKELGFELICLQMTDVPSDCYKGTEYAGDKADFRVVNVFNQKIEDINPGIMKRKIWDFLDKNKPDVVWSSYSTLHGLYASFWAKKNGAKFIFSTVTNKFDSKRNFAVDFFKGLLLRCFDGAFVGGKLSLEYLIDLKFDPAKTAVGSNYADNDNFARSVESAKCSLGSSGKLSDGYLLYVGRLLELKNLTRVIDAYKILTERGVSLRPFYIVGDGPYRTEFEKQVRDLGLYDLIFLEGNKCLSNLHMYYANASAIILPSTYEPWGLVINEAMASGLPIIVSSKCGCSQDLVRIGRNGWRFDAYDFNEMVKVLEEYNNTSIEQLSAMGEESRQIIEEYSPENFAKKGLALIEDLLKEKNKSNWAKSMFIKLAIIGFKIKSSIGGN